MGEREELQEILYDFFDNIIEHKIPIIFENQNGVRPIPPFISIAFNSISTLGTTPYNYPYLEQKGNPDDTDDTDESSEIIYVEKLRQPVERSIAIRGFGEDSEEYLNNIRNYLLFDECGDFLFSRNIVIKSIEDIIENVSTYSQDSEIFYSMDLIVAYERILSRENTYIEHLNVEGTITDMGDNVRNSNISNLNELT